MLHTELPGEMWSIGSLLEHNEGDSFGPWNTRSQKGTPKCAGHFGRTSVQQLSLQMLHLKKERKDIKKNNYTPVLRYFQNKETVVYMLCHLVFKIYHNGKPICSDMHSYTCTLADHKQPLTSYYN